MGSLDKDKIFEPYNAYVDRGMMKWMTAYSMEELAEGIIFNHQEALLNPTYLKETSVTEKEEILQKALEIKGPLLLQKVGQDKFGRYYLPETTYFLGVDPPYLYFSTGTYKLEDIHHLHFIPAMKWFHLED